MPADNLTPAAPPAPRFAFGWAALVYAVATLALCYPALAGGFLVTPVSDQYIGGFPVREFGASVLRDTGGFALWNPYIFGGLPYVAGMHGDIFYPTFLLRLIMPVDDAMTWSFIIHFFFAGLLTFGFLRACGLAFLPALIGGLAYMMGGPIASYVSPGHDGKLYVSTLYPLALWLIWLGIREGRRWVWGALALVAGLAVLSPHPQLLQYMLLSCGAFALFLAFTDSGAGKLTTRVAVQRLAFALGALVLGGFIGAIQYNPVREYVAWSPRAEGMRSYEAATSYALNPEEMLGFVLPEFPGILENYWGRNLIHLHSDYLGVAVLVLVGLAFARHTSAMRKRFMWFWAITALIGILWSLGGATPYYRLVYAIVPGTKFFRAPGTFFFVAWLALSTLAALGADRALRRDFTRRYLIGWGIAGGVILLLALTGALVNIGTSVAIPQRFDTVVANAGNVRIGAVRSIVFLLIGLALLETLRVGRVRPRVAGWALVVLVAVDLWSIERLYWRFSRPAAELYASDPAIDYIKKQDQPGRVLALAFGQTEGYHDPFLGGDALMIHDIRQVLGYHGNELGRFQRLYAKNESNEAQLQRLLGNPNFWKLSNMRYLLTNLPEQVFPGFTKVLGPIKNAAGSTSYLYTVPGDNPAAWVTPVIIKVPDDDAYAAVLDPRFDARQAALFDTSAKVIGKQVQALPAPLGITAKVTRYDPGHISVELGTPAPEGSALVVSENYYPGWRATVDGKPAAADRADFTLIGVALPTGARIVDLTFESRPYQVGKTITLLAIAISLGLAIWGIFLERRRRG
ncbi:MAG: hypothetical protein H7Z74_13780 [Anaerolineae bacterium]|nr:hypothetical protein [Gemmatimonadaceae bacterium]